jgi:Raf kinase inhibitor-like YbhB/YbcL family protein
MRQFLWVYFIVGVLGVTLGIKGAWACESSSDDDSPVGVCAVSKHKAHKPAIAHFSLTTSAFSEGARIPIKYTGEGEDISPALSWSVGPDGTKSFALICDDPDTPVGTWVHWVIFNIPADQHSLEEGIDKHVKKFSSGMCQGVNDFHKIGYGGPMPPPGHGTHRYFFKLYALDTTLQLVPGKATKQQVEHAMQGHILAESVIMGTYSRDAGK